MLNGVGNALEVRREIWAIDWIPCCNYDESLETHWWLEQKMEYILQNCKNVLRMLWCILEQAVFVYIGWSFWYIFQQFWINIWKHVNYFNVSSEIALRFEDASTCIWCFWAIHLDVRRRKCYTILKLAKGLIRCRQALEFTSWTQGFEMHVMKLNASVGIALK